MILRICGPVKVEEYRTQGPVAVDNEGGLFADRTDDDNIGCDITDIHDER